MSIDEINIQTAEYMIDAAKLEVALAKTFPLNLMPQLLEATNIDLAIAYKMKEIAETEAASIGQDNEADIRLKCAERRKSIYAEKYNAAMHLPQLDYLKNIDTKIKTLGKKTKNSKKARR